MSDDPVERLRSICLSFPEATEKLTWEDSNTFRVRDKIFAMTGHDADGRISVWCKGAPGAQEVLAGADPERFFMPPYVGSKGWIGIVLDGRTDWGQVAALVEESFRLVAPKRVAARLDQARGEDDMTKTRTTEVDEGVRQQSSSPSCWAPTSE